MKKIRSLLIDDNAFIVAVLSDLLQENHSDIEILGVAKNGREGIEKINQLNPDLVFLDIEMPDMTGFEMLNQLEDIKFQTIFTTSHSHYAIKAFRFNALDYLVKPIDENELSEAINRFKSSTVSVANQKQVQQALVNLQTKNIEDQKLVLPTQSGVLALALKQIRMIEGERNYSYIHLTKGSKELVSKTLSYLEDILNDKMFFRCHRSFLVNGFHVESIYQDSFILKDKATIPISRRKKSEAKTWFSRL